MLNPDDHNLKPVEVAGRAVVVILGITFGGIGVALIGFLWTEHGFGEPPTFFKIFGTLIALPFVAIGSIALLGGLGMKSFALKSPEQSVAERLKAMRQEPPKTPRESHGPPTSYTCPHCGAPLGTSSDASPHGDVKCRHCETWFNIYSG